MGSSRSGARARDGDEAPARAGRAEERGSPRVRRRGTETTRGRVRWRRPRRSLNRLQPQKPRGQLWPFMTVIRKVRPPSLSPAGARSPLFETNDSPGAVDSSPNTLLTLPEQRHEGRVEEGSLALAPLCHRQGFRVLGLSSTKGRRVGRSGERASARGGRARGSHLPGAGPTAARAVQASAKSRYLFPDDMTPKHVPHGWSCPSERLSGPQNGSRAGVESPRCPLTPQRAGIERSRPRALLCHFLLLPRDIC